MLIRAAQMNALGNSTRDTFESGLLSHIEEFFPVHSKEVGEKQMRLTIRLGMSRAASYGFETQREIYLFVSLMLYLGSDFDTDDQLPWAAAILNDSLEMSSFERIESTYASATEYLDRVAGPDGKYSSLAMERFIKLLQDLSRWPAASLLQMLGAVYPEKYRELDQKQLYRLATHGQEGVREYGLEPQGLIVLTGLAFLLGQGFAKDPQFPWIEAVLNNPDISDAEERLNAIRDASVVHLRRWIAGGGRVQ